ncbi:MAG: 4Fe-4S binding protein [Alphaproteobacteria bacterium]
MGIVAKVGSLTGKARCAIQAARLYPLILPVLLLFAVTNVHAAELDAALAGLAPGDIIPGADRIGAPEGSPPAAPVYRGEERLGYAFLNSDMASAVGYSGKPIDILIGIDAAGVIRSARLIEHHEPIVLVGIPEAKVDRLITAYVGKSVADLESFAAGSSEGPDIISGATVTVMVIDDSIRRAALKFAHVRGLGGLAAEASAEAAPGRAHVNRELGELSSWTELLGEGAIRRLSLSVGEVSEAFNRRGRPKAAGRPESQDPAERFIDLYVSLVSVPAIGRSLLGEAEYANLAQRLPEGGSAILIAGAGLYSFKGSGYVRGGIFDRFQLVQDELSVRFRDRQHIRLAEVAPDDAPDLREIGVFVLPADVGFDPIRGFRIELLASRAVGGLDKEFTSFDLSYQLPERYIVREAPPEPARATAPPAEATGVSSLSATLGDEDALWRRLWNDRLVDLAILAAALLALTGLFFFQDWFVRRPKLVLGIRMGFLAFIVGFLGYHANAQLSVVNVLTFSNALITEFRWEYFLMEPLIFMLWVSVAISLVFWGRGVFCGWLCPFGAIQELLNRAAKLARVPQIRVPWAVHERAWPIKYVIFIGLLGYSLYSLADAERLAEVEPFKTAVILNFMRDWPFVVYAGGLLFVGLFIERFFCRYLCPLGAALAIPGRLRIFDWLKRHKECGAPCHRCAHECMVQAIHPNGQINVNECIYCLHCQTLYYDEHRCPPMIQRRLKRERREALGSASMRDDAAPGPAGRAKGEPRAPTA